MKTLLLVAAALALVVLCIAGVEAMRRLKDAPRGRFAKRAVLTRNEQGMYWRIAATFPAPDHVIFGEVSFSALLRTKEGASRFSFSQKRADFVLMDKSFTVLAIIELDDASHAKKEASDAARDAMLAQAGYRVLRYKTVPQPDVLRSDVMRSPDSLGSSR